jgi:protein-disulfide isomerase
MKKLLSLLAVLAVLAAPVAAGQSQADYQALRKEMDLMRERLAALQKEVDTLKAQRAAAPAPVAPAASGPVATTTSPGGLVMKDGVPVAAMPDASAFSLARAPIRGAATARLALVEVSDFECPFCARYSNTTSGQLVNEFVNTGKIRYAFVHMPVASHRNAFKAAEASMCAADQGKFWEMKERLFTVAGQGGLVRARLPESATAIGIRADTFNTCLDSARHAPAVQADLTMVRPLAIRGTPTFFLGTVDPKTLSFKASRRIVGSKTFAVFQATLNAMLAAPPASTP